MSPSISISPSSLFYLSLEIWQHVVSVFAKCCIPESYQGPTKDPLWQNALWNLSETNHEPAKDPFWQDPFCGLPLSCHGPPKDPFWQDIALCLFESCQEPGKDSLWQDPPWHLSESYRGLAKDPLWQDLSGICLIFIEDLPRMLSNKILFGCFREPADDPH